MLSQTPGRTEGPSHHSPALLQNHAAIMHFTAKRRKSRRVWPPDRRSCGCGCRTQRPTCPSRPFPGPSSWFAVLLSLSHTVALSCVLSLVGCRWVVFFSCGQFLWCHQPAKCNSSTIHEDLGLVDYIFSDKTGGWRVCCSRAK